MLLHRQPLIPSFTAFSQQVPAKRTDNTGSVRAQIAGTGVATSPAPFTVAEQTAVLTLVQNLLPPLFLGLGPQWARIQGFTSDVATNTTQLSLLFDSILPPIWNDTFDTFPNVRLLQRLIRESRA